VNTQLKQRLKRLWPQHIIVQLRLAVLIATVLSVGCVSPDSLTTGRSESADDALVRALQQRTAWSASGALGIWTEPDSSVPQQNITASVQWAERGDTLDVTLRGPLGIGEMKLHADSAGASLKRGNSNVAGANPDSLVQQALGLSVPVPFSELSQWMRGLTGQANSVSYDGVGRLQSLRYADGVGVTWQVQILRYAAVDGLQVPEIITAKGGPYNIRLVLKRWRFDPVETDVRPVLGDSAGRLRNTRRSS